MLLYKTIVLELLQEQHTQLHNHLRLRRTLLQELDRYANELRIAHLKWLTLGTDASAARELAVEQLQETLAQDCARLET
jgi:hypothetical protein